MSAADDLSTVYVVTAPGVPPSVFLFADGAHAEAATLAAPEITAVELRLDRAPGPPPTTPPHHQRTIDEQLAESPTL